MISGFFNSNTKFANQNCLHFEVELFHERKTNGILYKIICNKYLY